MPRRVWFGIVLAFVGFMLVVPRGASGAGRGTSWQNNGNGHLFTADSSVFDPSRQDGGRRRVKVLAVGLVLARRRGGHHRPHHLTATPQAHSQVGNG